MDKIAIGLCSSNKSFKSYMDYRAVTDCSSRQYRLIQNLNKDDDGLLRDDEGYIAVALGSYYGDIGDRFIVELSSGEEVRIIKADEKAAEDTVDNCYHISDESMIEMIIDTDKAYDSYYMAIIMGDFNYTDFFNGSVIGIYRVEG